MSRNKYCILLVLFIIISFQGISQKKPTQTYSFEEIIEIIMEGLDEETDFSSVFEDLETFYEYPLIINSATKDELIKLHLLNDYQINQILTYRLENGPILSIFELNILEGLDRTLLEKIEPFISFELNAENLLNSYQYANHQIIIRSTRILQKQKGFKKEEDRSPAYEGTPEKLYTRYLFELGDKIKAGFTAEKDAGEAFFKGSNKTGFDYYSGYFSINMNSVVKISVGDFWVQSGQGLILWQGFAQRKTDETIQIIKSGRGIRSYSSTDENRYFRGIGTKLEFKDWKFQFFVSHKKRDANLETLENTLYFTSLQTSGYHRTENENEDEKSISETSLGTIMTFQKNRLKLGATLFYQKFNIPFIRDNDPYNFYRFSGKENINFGLDYYYVAGKYQFFGESAISKSGGKAFIQGILAHIHDQVSFSFLFRHFDKNYQTLTGNVFAENSGINNETGFYAGIKLLPIPKFRFSAYTDYYKSPWLTYTTIAPSTGHDLVARFDYLLSDKIQMYIRYKSEKKEVKTIEEEKYINSDLQTRRLRLNFKFDYSDTWKFRNRIEYSFYKKSETENGFMVYQDIIFSPEKLPLTTQIRIAYIQTDSYNSRIYAYENDLLYNYSMPGYFDKSIRAYINLKYRISDNWDLWFKIANTSFLDTESIGSGNNEIDGKNITEVKFQSRLKF